MNVPENAERKEITIQGITFSVPVVVTEEDFCESMKEVCPLDMAAQILQQTFADNWRNNFAKDVTVAIQASAKANEIGFTKVSALSDDEAQVIFDSIDLAPLQAGLDAYIREYIPGVRRTSGAESLSPVDRECHKLAVELVRDYLEKEKGIGRNARAETYKVWDAQVKAELSMTGAEYIEEMAEELIESNPTIRETAEANVQARATLASGVEYKFAAKA